ncbi:MAG TPA: hypothetical protein VFE32_20545 [Puia sp.]|nr:hypothetical protein [Puia sp.]
MTPSIKSSRYSFFSRGPIHPAVITAAIKTGNETSFTQASAPPPFTRSNANRIKFPVTCAEKSRSAEVNVAASQKPAANASNKVV